MVLMIRKDSRSYEDAMPPLRRFHVQNFSVMNSGMRSCKTAVCFDSADNWEDIELELSNRGG